MSRVLVGKSFFLAASRLTIGGSPLNTVIPNEEKTSGTAGYGMLVHHKVTSCIKFAGIHLQCIHLDGETHHESKVPCPRIQHNVHGQGLNSHC